MESKRRQDMNPEYMWDLSPIYESDDAWKAALNEASAAVKTLSDIPGTLGNSAEALKAGLDRVHEASCLAEKVYGYAFLRKCTDNGDPVGQEMEANAIGLLVALQTATAFLQPEILSIDADRLAGYMKREDLATYRHMIDDIARKRAHTLDAAGERMLAMLGDAAQTPSNVFEMFESVDMRFSNVHDEAGNEAPLTHGSFSVFRESRSQAVRKEAFETYFGE